MSRYLVTFTEQVEHAVWVDAIDQDQAEHLAEGKRLDGHSQQDCIDNLCTYKGWELDRVEREN